MLEKLRDADPKRMKIHYTLDKFVPYRVPTIWGLGSRCRGTSLIKNSAPLGPYSRTVGGCVLGPMVVLGWVGSRSSATPTPSA